MSNLTNYLKQGKEIKQNWTRRKCFENFFCVTFDRCCQLCISGSETRHQAISPPNLITFLKSLYFLRCKS